MHTQFPTRFLAFRFHTDGLANQDPTTNIFHKLTHIKALKDEATEIGSMGSYFAEDLHKRRLAQFMDYLTDMCVSHIVSNRLAFSTG